LSYRKIKKEHPMASELKPSRIHVDTGTGIFWFICWLFTIAFAKLIWWQAILGLAVR
jgi:hypothetical protein